MAPCSKPYNDLVALPQELRELLQLRHAQVGGHPVRVVCGRPMEQVIALAVAGPRPATRAAPTGPHEHVDHVLAPAVHQHRDGPSSHVIEPASKQWVPAPGEVVYTGREVEPAVEPRLYRVLIRREHIRQV